ncbi:MAG TPA: helix-turn-helix domain-containing protein [Puia sp.]|jgi:excisionase family DNA binding protein|nr:helix-turn-helix domain-containing protein [Puia sp.]
MEAVLERTTREDQKIAKTSIARLQANPPRVRRSSAFVNIKFQEKGVYLKIPTKAFDLLVNILRNMADGKSITLLPSDAALSTQQAADMLNVSRPHLVKLLEGGLIPYIKVGSHRRIAMQDIVAYEQKIKKTQADELNFLAQQAQDLNLGY